MPPHVAPMFEDPTAGGKAFGNFLELYINLSQNAWKMVEYSRAKNILRGLLNDAVYALGRRPEGYYVAIVMVTKDLSAGSVKGMIELKSGSASVPAPAAHFHRNHWKLMEPPGHRQHLILVHNVKGMCPVNFPMGSLDLEKAKATLQRLWGLM